MANACIVLSIAWTIEHYVQIGRPPSENRMGAFEERFVYIRETQYCLRILIVHSVLGFRQYMDPSWFGVIWQKVRVFKNWACCQKWLTSNSMNGSFLFAHTNAGSWNFVMRSTGIDTPLDPSLRPHRLESWSLNQSMQLKRQSTRRTLSQVPLFWAGVIIRTAPTETKRELEVKAEIKTKTFSRFEANT